ncbi:helix-turn-helix transcriptional regulator, partial [Bradyrhizobium ottawaense]|uniref:helix-turn-helix domain-containing protein n=1 Tax=Bradyrhizobium ottawaense TaxID=931866 RepID=UPI0030C683B8
RLGIGARVKAAREMRGYTQGQLAERLSVTPAFVQLAEQGEADIPLYQLMHIADLLMVSLDGLVAGPVPEEVDAVVLGAIPIARNDIVIPRRWP